jgi:cation diffusion facilitator CzcD-associated flavoprotein CzcO
MTSADRPRSSPPREHRNVDLDAQLRCPVDVLIVGSGFSGICMGARLRQAGIESFLIIEKADDLGGTWRDNRYPGCACDIPSHLYSLSFAPRTDWHRMYPTQPELWEYLRDVVDSYGLRPKLCFNVAMNSAEWDEANAQWRVKTNTGATIRARVLISGIGALHVPAQPRLPGLETFTGVAFHSATWRSDCDLAGKRVAVVGTGASAIQFVPEIAPKASTLHVFQRTPPWIVPKLDRPIGPGERRLFRYLPGYRRVFRESLYWLHELRALGFNGNRRIITKIEQIARDHLASQINDPELRVRLTPHYQIGCKRILISNDYYPTLTRPNVELVTDGIAEVLVDAVHTRDGIKRPIDVLIFGTGFEVADVLRTLPVIGRNRQALTDIWRDHVKSYYGICVNGFPNFFMLLGPNTGLGHNSVVVMIEAQVRYIISCLVQMRRQRLKLIEVKPEIQQQFFERIQEQLKPTVWQSGGCRSWYQDRDGHNVAIWPGLTVNYRWLTRRAKLADFLTVAA